MRNLRPFGVRVRIALVVMIISVALSSGASSQDMVPGPIDDDVCQSMVGTWFGEGTMFGMPATELVTYEWALDERVLVANHEMRLTIPESGDTAYTAISYMSPNPADPGHYDMVWIDSMGAIVPFDSQMEGEALVASWSDETGAHRSSGSVSDDGTTITVEYFSDLTNSGIFEPTGAMLFIRQ